MRFHARGAPLFLLLCVTAIGIAVAQEKGASSDGAYRVVRETPNLQLKPIAPRALSLSEGLAILSVALDSHHSQADFSADCSHFVHGLYERAGFPYEYASSSDLYAGIDEFRRVVNPQPGDLAVWRGHAGIVVNPVQHSFFSVLGSGPGVDSYDSPYWKQRGQPRFFRYIKAVPSGAVSTSIKSVNWQPKVVNDAERYESAPDGRVPKVSEAYSSQTASPARLAESQPEHSETPRVVLLSSARPKSDQVSAAFLQACNGSEEMLRGSDLFRLTPSLVVFDQFEVKRVYIKGNQGWIEVQIEDLVSLTGGKAEVLHKGLEHQRWALRRSDNKSWKLTPSRNAIYLPQHTAERLLAHELAQLTEDTPDNAGGTRDKAELARLLDVLFAK